jgi:hypothetical protein
MVMFKSNIQTAYAIMNENKGSFVVMVGTASTKYADDLKMVSYIRIKCAEMSNKVKPEASVSI